MIVNYFAVELYICMIAQSKIYDLLFTALRVSGLAYFGDSVPAAQMQEALMILNAIRAEYSINLRAELKFDQVFTAQSNMQYIPMGSLAYIGDYSGATLPTVGIASGATATQDSKSYEYDGANWNISTTGIALRPSTIREVVLMNNASVGNNNFRLPIYTYEEFRELMVQNVFGVPTKAFLDTEYPTQNLFLYPGITAGWTIRVLGKRYMTDYENVTDQYIDPPEYWQMLYLDLAMRLLTMYGQDIPQGLVISYNGAAKNIKANAVIRGMKRSQNDIQSKQPFNFLAGM